MWNIIFFCAIDEENMTAYYYTPTDVHSVDTQEHRNDAYSRLQLLPRESTSTAVANVVYTHLD